MKFLILTHVQHKLTDGSVSAYAPYVKEMNIWLKHVDEVSIVAPKTSEIKNDINDMRHHDDDFGAQANTNIKKRGQSLSHHNQQQQRHRQCGRGKGDDNTGDEQRLWHRITPHISSRTAARDGTKEQEDASTQYIERENLA